MSDTDLSNIPILDGLATDVIERLQDRSWIVNGNPGSPIYYSDDSANLVYFVLDGVVRLYYPSSKEREITLEFVRAGEIFGELSLVDFESRGESAEAVEDCTLEVIPGEFFHDIMEKNTDLYNRVFTEISRRRWRIQNRLKTLALEDAEKRVIYVLLDLAGELSKASELNSETRNEIDFTHQELADMANLARPTTTKVLNRLGEEELISLNQGTIQLESVRELFDRLDLPPVAQSP